MEQNPTQVGFGFKIPSLRGDARSTHHRHSEFPLRYMEVIWFALAVGLVVGQAVRLSRLPNAWDWASILLALFALPAADFVSGMIHWVFDTWGSEKTFFIGSRIIRPFRVHHHKPKDLLGSHFFTTNSDAACANLPFLLVALCMPVWTEAGRLAAVFLVSLAAWGLPTSQIHKWSHDRRPPWWVTWLQKAGLILGPQHHDVHHKAPHTVNYCITTGWCNRILKQIGFFPKLEWLICASPAGNRGRMRRIDSAWLQSHRDTRHSFDDAEPRAPRPNDSESHRIAIPAKRQESNTASAIDIKLTEELMMRRYLALIAFLGVVTLCHADDDKKNDDSKDKKPAPKLKVGDPVPALKADKWLQGAEVKEFAPGKIYVVEFWATWCGPCIVMMPHMAEMQTEYRDKGVTFIGYTAKDPNNTAEKVSAFVDKRGPKLGYTFAYSDARDTYKAWMEAADQHGIPCSFVVDRKGKIAFIGHPMYLGLVIAKVVADNWTEADVKQLDKVEEDVNEVFKALGKEPEAGLKALSNFESKYPALADIPYFVGPKISMLVKAKKTDEAKKLAQKTVAKAINHEDPMAIRSVSAALRTAKDKELKEMSLKIALIGLKMAGEKDLGNLLNVADAYFALDDKAKAREYGGRPSPRPTAERRPLSNAWSKSTRTRKTTRTTRRKTKIDPAWSSLGPPESLGRVSAATGERSTEVFRPGSRNGA